MPLTREHKVYIHRTYIEYSALDTHVDHTKDVLPMTAFARDIAAFVSMSLFVASFTVVLMAF